MLCDNKSPQICQHKAAQIYYLTVSLGQSNTPWMILCPESHQTEIKVLVEVSGSPPSSLCLGSIHFLVVVELKSLFYI